jgi:hypothetical protein
MDSLNITWKVSCFKWLRVKQRLTSNCLFWAVHCVLYVIIHTKHSKCTVMVWFLDRSQRLMVSEGIAQGVSGAPRSWEDGENYDRTQNLFKIARFLDLSILVYFKRAGSGNCIHSQPQVKWWASTTQLSLRTCIIETVPGTYARKTEPGTACLWRRPSDRLEWSQHSVNWHQQQAEKIQ